MLVKCSRKIRSLLSKKRDSGVSIGRKRANLQFMKSGHLPHGGKPRLVSLASLARRNKILRSNNDVVGVKVRD